MKHKFCVVIFLLIPLASFAQSDNSMYLTGNPKVDFFSQTCNCENKETILEQEGWYNNKAEKSPWLAGLLSLAIPGAGQIYSESYIKGALFFVAEVSFWTVAIIYDNKGDNQTKLFQDYADRHWSAVRYTKWIYDNRYNLNNNLITNDYELFNDDYEDPFGCSAPFRCVNWSELNRLEDSISRNTGNGFTHRLPPHGDQQYYELIGKYHQYSRGWDDEDLTDVNIPIRSNGRRFYEYSRMRKQANDYYDVANTLISVIVVNHIGSALDAFFTARSYNNALSAELKMKLLPTYLGVIPYTEAKLRYRF